MTENMAARGEGLAGAIACVKEFIAWATEQIGTSEAHGCAEQAEDALKLLEAAAPAGTAPELLCVNCGHSYAQHTKGINHPQKYCRHCPCLEWAALATPSPQAPQEQCNAFSPTSAREQSSATASANLSVAKRLESLADKWDSADYAIAEVKNPLLPQEQCAIELRELTHSIFQNEEWRGK